MKFSQFISDYKRKFYIKKFNKNCNLKTSSKPLYLQKNKHKLYSKIKFLKQATCIRHVRVKPSKFVQITMRTSSDSFLHRILRKLKRVWVSRSPFRIISDKDFSLVMLQKLDTFPCETVFASQVIQKNVFRVSYMGIWKVNIWLSHERIELSKWNKKYYSLF